MQTIRTLFKKARRSLALLYNLYLLRKSGLYDEIWYLNNNPDVAQAKINPSIHYLRNGGFEGRDPSPHFPVGGT
jgi:hypothetical protein